MTVAPALDLDALLLRSRAAARRLHRADRSAGLQAIADALEEARHVIIDANRRDVEAEKGRGTPTSKVDRLTLDEGRLAGIAAAVRQIADLPDPLDRVLDGWRLANGLEVRKVTVPFGVIGMIYESRPNVTVDAAALALKAGSAAVLRGSSNALASNRAITQVMRRALGSAGLPEDAVQLVDSPERHYVTELLAARGKIDLVIPRGGASLISHVVENARVPTIETGVGNCHVYVDAAADLEKARRIVFNAKVQRPGVCNAAETLLAHSAVAADFLPAILGDLRDAGVALVGCERARSHGVSVGAASEADWREEYLDLKLAVRVVDGLDEAIEHIVRYGSQHSEAIVTEERSAARRFQDEVDAAAVLVNASTRFTDGFEFGFGAEIGISTQKLHARGPMGLAALVTYKYLVDGEGQIRG
ncbi:MAG TPA: glutamate-5-semialdehyde dehydrogenase [Trueperaceae bacterium]